MISRTAFVALLLLVGAVPANAFTPNTPRRPMYQNQVGTQQRQPHRPANSNINPRIASTQLHQLLNLPDYFFTFSLPALGIISAWTNKFTRRRLEELAWEKRVEEAREKRLREDPTVTEIELRRKEASMEWSAYGKPRKEEEARERAEAARRVAVADRDYDTDDQSYDEEERRTYKMTDAEISQFEVEYGVDFDPYYDDPYTEEELPDDAKFRLDKKYGDRIYDNGEIFYKDRNTGLYYRQGAKPRNLSFWK